MELTEQIDIVNKHGEVVGKTTRLEAYKKGLLHKAVNIIILNSQNEIYIQQRSQSVNTFPLYWDISCAEHLKTGEKYLDGAIRGLKEELNMDVDKLILVRGKHIQKNTTGKNIIENELVELYGALYDGEIKVDNVEVVDGKFVTLDELKKYLHKNFTPWGEDEVDYLLKNYNEISQKMH